MNATGNQETRILQRVSIRCLYNGVAHSREEIQTHIGHKSRSHFMSNVLKPLLEAGALKTTANSKSKRIKYMATSKID